MSLRLERAIALVLVLGLLPSFTALSEGMRARWPGVAGQLGPINVLKIFAPLLIYFVWLRRGGLSPRVRQILAGAFVIGSLSTSIAALRCGLPPAPLREWAAISLGGIAAACLFLLSEGPRRAVLLSWGGVVAGTTLLDVIAPSVNHWLLGHLFDPATRNPDELVEVGKSFIGGVFGRQSLSKFLAWVPWVLLAWRANRDRYIVWAFALLSVPAALWTTQRAAFLGGLAAWALFALHEWLRNGRSRLAMLAGGAMLAGMIMTLLVVPREVLEPRLRSLLWLPSRTHVESVADANRDFRFKVIRFSAEISAKSPLGNACIPDDRFAAAGLPPGRHSHNMIIHQFRDRGWIWGLTHLGLWFLALAGAWRSRSAGASAWFAGISAALVVGLFDHPWFVLNQAMVLSTLIIGGITLLFPPQRRTIL